jgi:hypothetical protein
MCPVATAVSSLDHSLFLEDVKVEGAWIAVKGTIVGISVRGASSEGGDPTQNGRER